MPVRLPEGVQQRVRHSGELDVEGCRVARHDLIRRQQDLDLRLNNLSLQGG